MSWLELLGFWRFLCYITLILPGFVIMYYRFRIMNFEGPIFTRNDNPAAFAEHFLTRVLFKLVCSTRAPAIKKKKIKRCLFLHCFT